MRRRRRAVVDLPQGPRLSTLAAPALCWGMSTSTIAHRGARAAEREALLRAILETSPDGLITIDESGTINSFNPAAERMFGYRPEEVLGRNVAC